MRRRASVSIRDVPAWLQASVREGNEVAAIAAGVKRPGRGRPQELEFEAQVAFFRLVLEDPALEALPIYAVPNFAGHYGTERQRKLNGGRAKASGRRKGIPDVNVDVPIGVSPGLRFEFKVEGKNPDAEQKVWHSRLRALGFVVVVVVTPAEALGLLRDYLAGGRLARDGSDALETKPKRKRPTG